MSNSRSSARPQNLKRYAQVGAQINHAFTSEASRLAHKLAQFEATCTEYRVDVGYLPDHWRRYASHSQEVDDWVRSVGRQFEDADRPGGLRGFLASARREITSGAGRLRGQAGRMLSRLRQGIGDAGRAVRGVFERAVSRAADLVARGRQALSQAGREVRGRIEQALSFGQTLLSRVRAAGDLKAKAERMLSRLGQMLRTKLQEVVRAVRPGDVLPLIPLLATGLGPVVLLWKIKDNPLGAIIVSFIPLGDSLDLADQGLQAVQGKPVDKLTVALSGVGLVADLTWLFPGPDPGDGANVLLAVLKGVAKAVPEGPIRDAIAKFVTYLAKHPDEAKKLAEALAPLAGHPDVVEALIKNPQALEIILRYSSNSSRAAESLAKHGPEAVELVSKFGDEGLEVLLEFGDNGLDVLRGYQRIADIPGAKNVLQDLLAGGTTMIGALAEIRYVNLLRHEGVEIARVGDVMGSQKAADIILKDGTIIDVKDYNWNSTWYSSSFGVESEIKKLLRQVELRREQYPRAPIRYVFTGSLDTVPPRIVEALRKARVEVVGVP